MGVHNVEQAGLLAAQLGLNHRAARLLMWMACKALDEPGRDGGDPRLYFAGRDHLAIGLGHSAATSSSATAQRQVRTVLEELVAAEAIERVGGGHHGQQATFRLNLPAKPSRPSLTALDGGRKGAGDPPPTYQQGGASPASFRIANGGG